MTLHPEVPKARMIWTVKRFEPGISTYYKAASNCVFVGLDSPTLPSPFGTSHSAAAEWAANQIAESINAFALGMRS